MATPQAYIAYDGDTYVSIIKEAMEYSIIAEGEIVCKTADFVSAVCLLMCVHYVFNFAYNKKVLNTLTFIQKIILNITDETATPSKVVRVLYDMNATLSPTPTAK